MGKIFSGYTYISSSPGDFRKRFMSLRADQMKEALGLLESLKRAKTEHLWKSLEKYMEEGGV